MNLNYLSLLRSPFYAMHVGHGIKLQWIFKKGEEFSPFFSPRAADIRSLSCTWKVRLCHHSRSTMVLEQILGADLKETVKANEIF